jgi:DNA-binding CsgD family transcriptional regulator
LSARESTVLALIAKGQSNKRIAQTLGIAPETVKSHLKRAFLKLESKTRAEAVARASALGFLAQSQDLSGPVERRDFRIVERVLAAGALAARSSLP